MRAALRKWFLPIVAAIAAICAYAAVDDQPHRKVLRAESGKVVLNLDDCPPPAPGYTEVLSIVVHSSADGRPAVSSCTRYAERNYYNTRSPK